MNTTSKRQRRPSVRLAEIGDDSGKQLKSINKASKTRHFNVLDGLDEQGEEDNVVDEGLKGDVNFDNLAIGSWKIKGPKPKRESKRRRTNWSYNPIDHEHCHENGNDNDNVDEYEDGFSRDFELEDSESPLEEQNPVHGTLDNDKDLEFRARIDENVVDFGGRSDNGGQSARGRGEVDGVRDWLIGLGLGRYCAVFEFHEVDEEVLPLLTLEDLKDMGINAVGSRRKMFCAIQKLKHGFS